MKNTPNTFSSSLRRTFLGALVALAVVPFTLASSPAQAGGKDCGAFSVTISGGATLSGKQSTTLPASAVSGKTLFVKGTFVEFTVDLDTFTVTNYTLTSSITKNVRTVIYTSKTPTLTAPLTSGLSLNINNEQLVLIRSGAGQKMKIQAKDCSTGGLFQMEPDRSTIVTHNLAPGFTYFLDSRGRVLFTNGILIGRESPELATLVFPTLSSIPGATGSRWSIQGGGRMGMVVGEDATQ